MKRAREIVDSLCADLTTAINDVTERIMPAILHHGLEELPEELLTDILIRDSTSDFTRYRELRSVNNLFRSIVSSTPSCWSHVNTRKRGTSEMPESPVIRNASLPIDCHLGRLTPTSTFLLLKDRIRSIEWHFDLYGRRKGTPLLYVDGKADLPSVKTLHIPSFTPESDFPCGWTFSQLTSLECNGHLPSGPFPCLRHCLKF